MDRPTAKDTRGIDWSAAAIGTQTAMLVYFVVDNHVDLYPWNNLRDTGSQLPSTLTGVIPFSLSMVAFANRDRRGMLLGAAYAWLWLSAQILQWWVPYLSGRQPMPRLFGGKQSQWYHEQGYDKTIRVLPQKPGRIQIDAQHTVLQILSLLVAISTTIAAVRARR